MMWQVLNNTVPICTLQLHDKREEDIQTMFDSVNKSKSMKFCGHVDDK